jgi:hypothetical protein
MIAVSEPLRTPGAGEALRRAARDFYEESWRFVLLNGALSAYVLLVLAVAAHVPAAVVLLVGAGPLVAMLVAASVIVVETGSLTLVEAAGALRRCWRRGLALGCLLGSGVVATVIAFRFYGGAGAFGWPFAALVAYLGGVFLLYQLLLWPHALRDLRRPLRQAAIEAGVELVRRPGAVLALGLALLGVNLLALIAAVLPLLTMTIAYSALATTRFVLPLPALEED